MGVFTWVYIETSHGASPGKLAGPFKQDPMFGNAHYCDIWPGLYIECIVPE